MLQEEKYFNGAVQDSDNAIEYTQPNAILDGLNVRIQTQEGNKQGLVVTLEGNREIARTLPAGTNTVLRSKYFPEVGKAYIFTKNSNGLHRIEEFDVQTETFITIFEDLTDSGSEQLLDWGVVEYIKDVVIVQDKLLYFVEFPADIARRIYLDGTYSTFTADHFYLSVRPPMYAPHVYFNSDGAYDYNNIRGRLFQFRSRYHYSHGEYSSWSPISSRIVPEGEPTTLANSRAYNTIMVGVPYNESSDIEKVEISARFNDSDWFSIKTVTRQHVLGLPVLPAPPDPQDPTDPPILSPTEFRTADADAYYFAFYNDGLYPADDILEHDNIADIVPENTRALESVNDNTILLGNNTIGKPRPSVESFQVNVLYGSPPAPPDSFRLDWTTGYNLATERAYVTITFRGLPQEGDTIVSSWYTQAGSGFPTDINHTVTAPEAGDIEAAVTSFANLFPTPPIVDKQVVSSPSTNLAIFRFEISSGVLPSPKSIGIQPATVLNENESIPAVKQGSSYEFMLAYYDRYGRPFPLVQGPIIKTPTFATSKGTPLSFQWVLDEDAPDGAAYFQILSSTNRTHSFSAYTLAYADNTLSDSTYMWLNIGMLFAFNEDVGSGNLAWDFVPGDRVSLIRQSHTATPESYTWFNDPSIDLEILEYNIDVTDPDNPVYLIKVPNPAGVAIPKGPEYPINIEIYRRKDTLSPEQQVYYEVTPTYRVIGGQHEQTTGFIEFIDSYYKLRRIPYTFGTSGIGFIDMWVEGFHFSDIYKSDYHNLGRVRTYNDTPEGTTFKTEIRYSREWISGSRVNGIVRFYPEDVYDSREPMYGASENYGGIQYLTNRENRLICLQELKVGYIPVNRSIIEDTLEQQQVGISSKLLNPITYYAGSDIGIGKDYAIPSYKYVNGAAYFIDPHEMLPVRAGLDGTRYIQSTYSGEMKRKIREMVTSGNYIFSVWDDRMNEWLVVFNDYTYVYDEKSNGWIPKRSYLPSSGFTANDRLYTTNVNGQLYIHDDESNRNRFYGVDYPAELKFPITSPRVKTYQSIALHMDDEVETVEDGIETQLGHVSDLVVDDFTWREGIRYANFLRDKNSGTDITNGDRLKGRWITLHLVQEAPVGEWNLIKAVCKSAISTNNE